MIVSVYPYKENDSTLIDKVKAKPLIDFNSTIFPHPKRDFTGKLVCVDDDFPIKLISINPFKTEINYNILAGMGALFLGTGYYIDYYQRKAWWLGGRTKLHLQNDWSYALNIDKIGHFYATNLYAHAFSGGYEAANMQAEQSTWFSALSALLFELYIETEDGFHKDYGFSPGDAGGDVLGSAFYIAQYYYPFLKNFQPRFSYIPTEKLKHTPNKIFIDDYEGQKYWMSMRMKNILPEGIADYWPSFLNLSVGMGVKNLNGSGGGQREFYIAFDLDTEELPLYGSFWQFMKNSFNYIHFPMPGIRITPNSKFFVLCF
ncbi:MAG: DUF2279 domain-containing protein [Ignavibacteriales bacterium]|nr:DUF2279 domain-containing protein [Ignavibacteriales bacterium]